MDLSGGGTISERPAFIRPVQGVCMDRGGDGECLAYQEPDYHLQLTSPCINAGDPGFEAAGISDIDGELRVMGARLDIGADEVVSTIRLTSPTGGEVWVAHSSHAIVWESFGAVGNVDLLYTVNGGVDWIEIAVAQGNTGNFPWILSGVNSNEVIVKVEAHDAPNVVMAGVSGEFAIHASESREAVTSRWPTLGKGFVRSGLTGDVGPELARFSVDSSLAYPVIGADGTVYVSDSANVVRAISTSACTETQADLHRPIDITGDRITNFEDYAALLGDYLACTDVANTEAACNGSGPAFISPAMSIETCT